MPSLSKIAAVAAGALTLVDAKACPPLGAVFPPPQAPGESPLVQKAAAALKTGLEARIVSQFNNSGLAIGVKSIHEEDPLFTYHFTPPNPGEGSDKVDEDTVFRIASGSKLFTALAARVNEKIDLQASVLKYLPELNKTAGDDDILSLKWEDITVGSLASHLSGVGVDSKFLFFTKHILMILIL
jgi:CubicO group peptidase (beta-lactamase class C family)